MGTPEEERNKQIIIDYVTATTHGDRSYLDKYVVEDYVDHDPIPDQKPGLEGLKDAYDMFNKPFSDLDFDFQICLAEGQFVVGRGVGSGVHTGDLFGIPPTGIKVRWSGTRLFRLEGGMLHEGWINLDLAGLMVQLGQAPAPPGFDAFAPDPPSPDTTGMAVATHDEKKAIMRRMIDELWCKGDLAVADELFHPLSTSPSAPQLPPGPEGVKGLVSAFRSAFPDYWMEITHLIADEDKVFARFRQGGTHEGDLMGIPATGKKVEWTEMGILKIAGGQIVQSWYDVDMAGLMMQLGVAG